MKILVTGGTGYIGSHTVVELIKAGHEVTIIDNLFNSKIEVLDKIATLTGTKPEFHKLDILDLNGMRELFQSHDFEAVIHFAGLKAVAESIEKPLEYYETNVQGTVNLLKCMAEFNVNKIIFSSSATVYGSLNSGKLDESMTTGLCVTNPYGETKHVIEKILEAEAIARPELSVVILRYLTQSALMLPDFLVKIQMVSQTTLCQWSCVLLKVKSKNSRFMVMIMIPQTAPVSVITFTWLISPRVISPL